MGWGRRVSRLNDSSKRMGRLGGEGNVNLCERSEMDLYSF